MDCNNIAPKKSGFISGITMTNFYIHATGLFHEQEQSVIRVTNTLASI
jgi:hypothetical protein